MNEQLCWVCAGVGEYPTEAGVSPCDSCSGTGLAIEPVRRIILDAKKTMDLVVERFEKHIEAVEKKIKESKT